MNDVVGVNSEGSFKNQQEDRYFSNNFMAAVMAKQRKLRFKKTAHYRRYWEP